MPDENLVHIPIGSQGELVGDLLLPPSAKGLVVFAHGSGSSRHSPRNRFVASILQKAGMGTLLIDLLTEEEGVVDDATGALRFDIALLTDRLCQVTRWLQGAKEFKELKIAYFGASTGAAAALCAAALIKKGICSIVSRGGRPDLARDTLKDVTAATLLIVGGKDLAVIQMNAQAYALLPCEKKTVIIEGATHLFEETGALEKVAFCARDWFLEHFNL